MVGLWAALTIAVGGCSGCDIAAGRSKGGVAVTVTERRML